MSVHMTEPHCLIGALIPGIRFKLCSAGHEMGFIGRKFGFVALTNETSSRAGDQQWFQFQIKPARDCSALRLCVLSLLAAARDVF